MQKTSFFHLNSGMPVALAEPVRQNSGSDYYSGLLDCLFQQEVAAQRHSSRLTIKEGKGKAKSTQVSTFKYATQIIHSNE